MGSISTQGWDTVFAVRLPEVNATLARAVADQSAQLPDVHWTSDDGLASLDATFGVWSISSKDEEHSGGTLVTMLFPVLTGTFIMLGKPEFLNDVTLEASVQLTALDDDPKHRLIVDPSKPISITAILSTPQRPDDPTVRSAFEAALTPALKSLAYAFATVDPSKELATSMPFLAPSPKGVAYSFVGGAGDADSYLGRSA